MTRVFVTGMGAITPIGNDVDTYWQSLIEGKSGAGRVTLFESRAPQCAVCGCCDASGTRRCRVGR